MFGAWTFFGKEVINDLLDCEVAEHHTWILFVIIQDQEALVHSVYQSQVVFVGAAQRIVQLFDVGYQNSYSYNCTKVYRR